MVVGTIIGASIFVQPSEVTGAVPSVGGVFAVWIVAGVLTLAGALITAELAAAVPDSGGVYAFLREAYSPAAGFLWGWAMFWSMHSGIIAVLAVVFGRYVAYFVPLGDTGVRAVAVAAILGLSAVNYLGVALGSGLQAAVTIVKVGAIVALLAVGFWLGADLPAHYVGAAAATEVGVAEFAAAVSAGLFAFGGWHMVAYTAEETRDPERTLPRALVIGTLMVTATYIALNALYLYILPLDRVATSQRIAADAADAVVGGGAGGALMSALVVGSTFGALCGIVLVGPRVYYALARDGLLFRWVGAVHPRFQTPHRAIVLQALWSAVLVASGTYRALFTRVVYTEWIFFAGVAVGLLVLRRRPGYAPAYRVRGGPAVPLLFAAAAVFVAVSQIVAEPANSAVGLLIVLAGLPVYLLTRSNPT